MKPLRSRSHLLVQLCPLKRVALLCGMLFGVSTAPAAVIYYQPPGRLRLHNFTVAHHNYNIDLNGDGLPELRHNGLGGSAYLQTWGETRILGLKQPFGPGSWYDSQPYPLPTSTVIGPDSPSLYPEFGQLSGWWSHPSTIPGVASLHVRYDVGTSGFFVGSRGFIGIEFLIDEQIHYGWIDLDNYTWWQSEIHGWAYESEPGKPILAGSIPEPSTLLLAFTTLISCLFIRRRWDENIKTKKPNKS